MTALDNADFARGGSAEINCPPANERAAIIDPYHHRFAIALVGDADLGAERQSFMRGGHRVHIELLTIGGAAAMKAFAVVARYAITERADNAALRLGFGPLDRRGDSGDINLVPFGIGEGRGDRKRRKAVIETGLGILR